MIPKEIDNLLYRRQFILTPREIKDFQLWKKILISTGYILYVHPDLNLNETIKGHKHLILLGDIFDPRIPARGNLEILEELSGANSIEELTNAVYFFAGRYAIISILKGSIYLFNDPSASRKIFYTKDLRVNWCASQPHVIAKYCGIERSDKQEVVNYYSSDVFFKGFQMNIGDNTKYDNIKQLMPNHYLDLKTGKNHRFWPTGILKRLTLSQGVEKASEIITGIMESFNTRYKLMLPVTGGNDSRVLLAAGRRIVDNIYLYLNKNPRMSEDHFDLQVSQKLLNKLGITLNINYYDGEVDPAFEAIYNLNSSWPVKSNMGLIYNVYYKRFPDYVNLPGSFSDVTRNFFSTYRKKITPQILLKNYVGGVQRYQENPEYFLRNFRKWLEDIEKYAGEFHYNILDLFNWEERGGNWGTAFQEDKDIAQEDLMAYNNRSFIDICLGVKAKYRDIDTNVLYRSMVKHMWPELLKEPMYPKSWTRYYLKRFHFYWPIRRLIKDF